MTVTIVRSIRHVTDPDLLGGPNGLTDDVMLVSGGGGDKVLQSDRDNIVLVSGGGTDEVLISPGTCKHNLLVSPGDTDKILVSGGGTDEILISGHCTSSLLDSGKFIVVRS